MTLPHFADDLAEAEFDATYVFIEPDYGNILPSTSEDFTCGNSQHPLDDITRGEKLIKDTYEAIRNSPHWNRSLLIITYDEHGGFYDHVPPVGATPPGDDWTDPRQNKQGFDFSLLGVRVPTVIVSPLIPRGTSDHTQYDHTSVLKTLDSLFDLGWPAHSSRPRCEQLRASPFAANAERGHADGATRSSVQWLCLCD